MSERVNVLTEAIGREHEEETEMTREEREKQNGRQRGGKGRKHVANYPLSLITCIENMHMNGL